MYRRTLLTLSALVLLGFSRNAAAQTLVLELDAAPEGAPAISVNYSPESSQVVALQFDLKFDVQRLSATGLQVSPGQALTANHGFGFKQLKPGLVRVVVYPPIQKNMPVLAAGPVARIHFPGLEKLSLRETDMSFVPGSVIMSDASAKTVRVRRTPNLLGRGRGRIKK